MLLSKNYYFRIKKLSIGHMNEYDVIISIKDLQRYEAIVDFTDNLLFLKVKDRVYNVFMKQWYYSLS